MPIAHFNPWPHRAAMLLVCATFPLIWVGGLVTSYDAGMAVPDWPTTYGYNLFLYPWTTWIMGPWDIFVEHGHRLLGAVVGLIAILLVVVVYRTDRRAWLRILAVMALVAVIGQGLLGGLRVQLNERLVAMVHACVAPAFFAFVAAIAVVTSRRWSAARSKSAGTHGDGKIRSLAIATSVVALMQIVAGAQLRHAQLAIGPSGTRIVLAMHLLLALVLLVQAVLVASRAVVLRRSQPYLVGPALMLVACIVAQIGLGFATWVVNNAPPSWFAGQAWAERFVVPAGSLSQALTTTAHVATGSLILAFAVVLSVRACRGYRFELRGQTARSLAPEAAT